MNIRYIVELTEAEREQLRQMLAGGVGRSRRLKRAQILLACDVGVQETEIAQTIGCGTATIYRLKKRFVEHGLQAALEELPRPGVPRKLTGLSSDRSVPWRPTLQNVTVQAPRFRA